MGEAVTGVGVIYCGSCGALNPRTNHFCSVCGHQLVDAYHASEGLRVFATPDPAAPLVDILPSGTDLTVVETQDELPSDFVKVALDDGRIGYVRLRDVEAGLDAAEPQAAPREPVGCITSTSLLAVMGLLVLAGTLVLVTALRAEDPSGSLIAWIACLGLVPFFFLTGGFYLYVRKREQELLAERAEQASGN